MDLRGCRVGQDVRCGASGRERMAGARGGRRAIAPSRACHSQLLMRVSLECFVIFEPSSIVEAVGNDSQAQQEIKLIEKSCKKRQCMMMCHFSTTSETKHPLITRSQKVFPERGPFNNNKCKLNYWDQDLSADADSLPRAVIYDMRHLR